MCVVWSEFVMRGVRIGADFWAVRILVLAVGFWRIAQTVFWGEWRMGVGVSVGVGKIMERMEKCVGV